MKIIIRTLIILLIIHFIITGLKEGFSNNKTITDFCEIYKKNYNKEIEYPNDINELQSIVKDAYRNNINLRIRGGGHSCSGISVPKDNEIVISLKKFNKYNFSENNTITVGSGIDITNLNNFLEELDYFLPVVPGGINSEDIYNPTVGGFISAGGVSQSSSIYGGFWENVIEIELIDGLGNLRKYNNNYEIFPWLFSNFGLLGIIISAKLKILTKKNVSYPFGKVGEIMKSNILNNEKYIFYHVLCDKEDCSFAKKKMKKIFEKYYDHKKNYFAIKNMNVKFINFNPPLLYPNKDFEVILAVQHFGDRDNVYKKKIRKIESDVMNLINSERSNIFYRYPQVEFIDMNIIQEYYKKRNVNFEKLLEYKKELDPNNIINSL